MSICIVTDSAADLPASSFPVEIVPLHVLFGDEDFLDGATITHDEFYRRLSASAELPKTSQPTPYQFEEIFRRIVAEGNEVICITLSSRISGTWQSACIAAEDFPETVFVVDSMNATIGEGLLVQLAVRMVEEGKSSREIVESLNREKNRIHLMGVLDTIEYLRKGGRISAAAALAGNLLSIKPVVTLEDGVIISKGKARGSKQGSNLLIKEVTGCGGIDFSMPLAVGYTGDDHSMLERYLEDSRPLYENHITDIPQYSIGATIGTHVGPGVAAVAFFERN